MNEIPAQYHNPVRLEQLLGDPGNGANLFSFRNAMLWDEEACFPEAAVVHLHQLGLHHVFVPGSLGGRFEYCESLIAFGRVLARRNMSVAISYSTMVWTMLAWIGGDAAQRRRLALAVLRDGEFPCLAYSEESHGADLFANETAADLIEDGRYRVCGEKWPINRATRSKWVVLLARTNPTSQLRGHSLFIFSKDQIEESQYYNLPGVKTHGLRGCDISGIGFRDCLLPIDARIGREGDGIQLALKGFQITRTFCTALSLGVGDSALRIVADFGMQRHLYGTRVAELPHARDTFANAYLSLLMAECASVTAARGMHLFVEQFSTWSSVAKVQVSRLTDFSTQQLAAILGARAYIRERHAEGMFQKFLRDGAIVAVFDGSNIVCLDRLAAVLPKLCRSHHEGPDEDAVAALFDLRRPLPSLGFHRFTLMGRGNDIIIQSLELLGKKLMHLQPDHHCDAGKLGRLKVRVRRLLEAVEEMRTSIQRSVALKEDRNSAARFGLAERYCELHTAICCLGFWLFNREHLSDFAARGEWLLAALDRRGNADFRCGTLDPGTTESLCGQLFSQTERSEMYSLIRWPLAKPGQREQHSDAALYLPPACGANAPSQ